MKRNGPRALASLTRLTLARRFSGECVRPLTIGNVGGMRLALADLHPRGGHQPDKEAEHHTHRQHEEKGDATTKHHGHHHHHHHGHHAGEEEKGKTLLLPRLPVVLCPGLIFWNDIPIKGMGKVAYWGGVPAHIRGRGVPVVEASVPGTAHLSDRAAELRRQVDEFLAMHRRRSKENGQEAPRKVNLVAFSMGGLDARCMVSLLNGHEVVESLTTISTPHRGSSLAKWFLEMGYDKHLVRTGFRTEAFHCLTPQFVQGFNEVAADHPNVQYYSYAGFKPRDAMTKWGKWAYDRVYEREGPNDGFVGVAGAKWGRFLGTVSASHLELLDWSWGVRAAHRYRGVYRFYDELLHQLALLGH